MYTQQCECRARELLTRMAFRPYALASVPSDATIYHTISSNLRTYSDVFSYSLHYYCWMKMMSFGLSLLYVDLSTVDWWTMRPDRADRRSCCLN